MCICVLVVVFKLEITSHVHHVGLDSNSCYQYWLHCCQELKCLSWHGNKSGWDLLQGAYGDGGSENEENESEDENESDEGDVGLRPPTGQEPEHHEMAGEACESQSEATDPAETQIWFVFSKNK